MHFPILAILAGIIPSFIWLFFWTREDVAHPESRLILTFTFFGGMLAVAGAIIGEQFVGELLHDSTIEYITWAAIEEVTKFIAVAAIALWSSQNDEPIDAMIYCVAAALGFAALENTLFILDPLMKGDLVRSVIMGNMRFMGATLVHVVSSASIGFALGLTFYRGIVSKIVAVSIGLVVATAIHASFNLSIINSDSGNALATFGWVWGAVVILIILFEEVKVIQPRRL